MAGKSSVGCLINRFCVAGMLLLLCSCSLDNPYVRSNLLKCGPSTAQDGLCSQPDDAYVGGAAAAIQAANDQRNLYISELGKQYTFNAAMGLGIIGLSADAVYKGLTSGSTSHNKPLAAVGAGAAGLYGIDAWLHNKATESAYIVGFQGITCTLLRTRAILLPKSQFAAFDEDVNQFEVAIAAVDKTLSELQIARDFGQEVGLSLEKGEKDNLEREINNVYATLAKSRKLLLIARSYEGELTASGQTIRSQVDLIVAGVSAQLAQSEPNVSALKGLVGSYSDPSKGIAGLQGVTVTPSGSGVALPFYDASPGTKSPAKSAAGTALVPAEAAAPPRPAYPDGYQKRRTLRENLWLQVSDLYARSRKINAVIDTAQHFYLSTRRISACELGGGPPPLEITPATVDEPVAAGKTLKFSISGGIGIPEVSLDGSTGTGSGDAKAQDLVLGVNGNSLTAAVTILPAASGTLTLVAADKGQPPQQVKVTIDVEKPGAAQAKATFKATPGDKRIDLGFATPSVGGGTLNGYTVTVSTGDPAVGVSLKFSSPKSGTKATSSSAAITGEITADSGGDTAITIGGLTNGASYTVGLAAHFSGASDLQFEDAKDVKPAAPAIVGSKPAAPSIKSVSSKGGAITVSFDAPGNGGSPITGYVATARNTDNQKSKDVLTGKSQKAQPSVDIPKCTAGNEYTVTVVSVNAVGSSAASKPSAAVKCNAGE